MTSRPKAELTERLLLALSLSILAAYMAWTLSADHRQIESSEGDRLTTQAKVIDQNLGRQLDAVNNALASLQGDLPSVKTEKDGLKNLNRKLLTLSSAMPGVRSIFVLDGAGIAIAVSRPELVGQDYHDRAYFAIARQRNDPAVLHVSPPIKSARGVYTINLERSLADANGGFAGLVGASLEPDYFTTLLSSVLYAPDMSVSLIHADGTQFVVAPGKAFPPGFNLAKPGSMFSRHMASGQTTTLQSGRTQVTETDRMVAQRTVRPIALPMDYPLVVGVSRNRTALFAPWRREIARQGAWLALLALVSGGVLLLFQRRRREFGTIAVLHEQERDRLAYYDPLTGLPNRRLLLDRLHKAKASSSRNDRGAALIVIDLDDFKTVNDLQGHHVGDQLLQQVAARLGHCIREGDTVARLGGDEFVVILEDLSVVVGEAAGQVESIGQKILGALTLPYALAGQELLNTPSLGATLFSDPHDSVQELLRRADFAMYQAKAAGRNCLRFFDPEIQKGIEARVSLESDLREGIRGEQFRLVFQCQVDANGLTNGAEALVRWQHPVRGQVSPAAFIPLAEETGLILPIGHWVLEAACRQIVAWRSEARTAELTLAVNVSARQFRQDDFVTRILAVIRDTGADPGKLKLELTESMLVNNVEDTIVKMNRLRDAGFTFSLDDFGTGYSSLSYLKRLPLSQLKIDRSFVRDVMTDPNDASIARTIVALGQGMGMKVIAEGVETRPQRDFLHRHGCLDYQGFLFGRPLPIEEFERSLTAGVPGE